MGPRYLEDIAGGPAGAWAGANAAELPKFRGELYIIFMAREGQLTAEEGRMVLVWGGGVDIFLCIGFVSSLEVLLYGGFFILIFDERCGIIEKGMFAFEFELFLYFFFVGLLTYSEIKKKKASTYKHRKNK